MPGIGFAQIRNHDFELAHALLQTETACLPVLLDACIPDIWIGRIDLPDQLPTGRFQPSIHGLPVCAALVQGNFRDTNNNGVELVKQAGIIQVCQHDQRFRGRIDHKCRQPRDRRQITVGQQITRSDRLYGHAFKIPQAGKQGRRTRRRPQTVHVSKTGPPERALAPTVRDRSFDQFPHTILVEPAPNNPCPIRVGLDQDEIIDPIQPSAPCCLATPDVDDQAEASVCNVEQALHHSPTFLGAGPPRKTRSGAVNFHEVEFRV